VPEDDPEDDPGAESAAGPWYPEPSGSPPLLVPESAS
jgi:hypothetical protein